MEISRKQWEEFQQFKNEYTGNEEKRNLLLQNIDDTISGGIRSANLKEYRNTYVINAQDSLDDSYPFLMSFNIISEMTKIVSIKLSFWILPYRAYSFAGTASELTVTCASAIDKIAHNGGYLFTLEAIPSSKYHTHAAAYGIFEEDNSPTIGFQISRDNGKTYGAILGKYPSDVENLEIKDYITTRGSKIIKFTSTARARLSVQVTIKLDIKAR